MLKSALKFEVNPEFTSRAYGSLRSLPTVMAGMPSRFVGGLGNTVAGSLAGWGAMVLLGALLMSHAARETTRSTPIAAVEAPKAAVVTATPKVETATLAVETAPAPTPAPAPKVVAKATTRVDMTPTGALANKGAPKPKHKSHKKKAKALDRHP